MEVAEMSDRERNVERWSHSDYDRMKTLATDGVRITGFYTFLSTFLPEEYQEDLNRVADYDFRTRTDAT